jgi:hypothetical protein
MVDQRPSDRELYNKIEEAKSCLKEHKGRFANQAKIVGELYELEIDDTAEVWGLIRELLNEIKPNDYAGARPPQKSYEKAIVNKELLAFSWQSTKLGKKMYLKFALQEGLFYYVSLHESRQDSKEYGQNEMFGMRGRKLSEEESSLYARN